MDRSTTLLLALTSRDLAADIPPLKARDLWTAVRASADRQIAPAELFGDEMGWQQIFAPDLHASVAARLEIQDQVPAYADQLRQGGIWISTPFEETWPSRLQDRLRAAAPLVIYGAGDPGLLATDGIGVVGSRNLSPEGETVAREIAAASVGAELTVVSGGARGADQIAMSAAVEAGGHAIGVLAHPLTRTTSDSWTAAALDDGRLCLATPFKPDNGFSVGNAMGRNKLIYALSRVTAVVASDRETGGTWSGAKEALDRAFGTVAVWRGAGEGPGNEALAAFSGARAITEPSAIVDFEPSAVRQPSLL